MSTYTIREGAHFHTLLPISTLPWIGDRYIARYVEFNESAKYDASAYNGQDVNKLFGLQFGAGLRKQADGSWDFGIHWNSARFGWRWSQSDQCIELVAYVYNEGTKNWDSQLRYPVVAQVQPGQKLRLGIMYHEPLGEYPATYSFEVGDFDNGEYEGINYLEVPAPSELPKWGLTCGPYWGGQISAVHTFTVKIDRIK